MAKSDFFISGVLGSPSNTANNYANPWTTSDGGWGGATTESQRAAQLSMPFLLTSFQVYVTTNPGASGTRVFTVMRNGLATGATVTFNNVNGLQTVTPSAPIAFSTFDTISIESAITGTVVGAGRTYWTLKCTGVGQQIGFGNSNSQSNSVTGYLTLMGFGAHAATTVVTDHEIIFPTSGVIDLLDVSTLTGTVAGATTYDLTVVYDGVDSSLAVQLTGGASEAQDFTSQVRVAAGKRAVIKVVPGGSPTARAFKGTLRFTPDTDGESVLLFGDNGDPNATANRFGTPEGYGLGAAWNATEANADMLLPAGFTPKGMYISNVTAPGVGKSFRYRVRQGTVGSTPYTSSGPNVLVSDTATTGNDATTGTATSSGAGFALIAEPTGTPALPGGVHGGIVFLNSASVVSETILQYNGAEIADLTAPWNAGADSYAGTISLAASGLSRSPQAFRTNPTTTGTGYVRLGRLGLDGKHDQGGMNIATGYHEGYFKPATISSHANGEVVAIVRSISGVKASLFLKSNGVLVLTNQAGTVHATGTTVLSTGVEYHIGVKIGTNSVGSSNATYQVTINGVTEFSGSNLDATTFRTAFVDWGKGVNTNGTSVDYYLDDLINSEGSFVGIGHTERLLLVNGAGASMGWFNSGGGAGSYTYLDESTPDFTISTSNDDALKFVASGNAFSVAMFDTTGNLPSSTIKAVKTISFAYTSTLGLGARIRRRVSSTNYDSNDCSFAFGSGSDGNTHSRFLGVLDTVSPATAVAWTTAEIDGMEVGGNSTTWITNGLGYIGWMAVSVLVKEASARERMMRGVGL